jgi:ribosomal protein S18 acetylase RimI-like enzyme
MNQSAVIRPATPPDAKAIAALHAALISEGFLVVLGRPFLERLYRRIVQSDTTFVFVSADPSADINGFVAVAEDTGRLYRDFLVHDGVHAGLRAAPALVRHPRKVFETLRHGTGGGGEERAGAEILAVAVAEEARGRGIGVALVAAVTAELRRRGITRAHVVTASTNEPARRMYEHGGFERHGTIEVHRGIAQELLVWK